MGTSGEFALCVIFLLFWLDVDAIPAWDDLVAVEIRYECVYVRRFVGGHCLPDQCGQIILDADVIDSARFQACRVECDRSAGGVIPASDSGFHAVCTPEDKLWRSDLLPAQQIRLLYLDGETACRCSDPAVVEHLTWGDTANLIGSPVFNGKLGQKRPKHANERK